MRRSEVFACALAAGALLAGCHVGTQGTPVTSPGSPTEPSFPTSRPSTSRPTAAAPTKSPPSAVLAGVAARRREVLRPQESGYVFIETKSGQTRCQIDEHSVGVRGAVHQRADAGRCAGQRGEPVRRRQRAWIVGNLGDIPVVTIDYRTYSAVGWTIVATADGTRFTNQRTKHGMFVSIEKVETF